ncbi:MAG TPA: hypothetical protein ENI79_02295 [Rhodospirillales bacterium]|nr:hypothetical protein [Rhodospirillales bacterium]
MATSLKTRIDLRISGIYTKTLDLQSSPSKFNILFTDTLANGTGLDQADQEWSDQRTLAATSEEIDLAGSVNDIHGTTLTFAKIKGIYIRNLATTVGYDLAVGGSATNGFINWVGDATDIINIAPGGVFCLYNPSLAGYAVTAGTGDLLKINAGANSITYDIALIGTSA